MNPEYINIYGYILLVINICTMVPCFGSAFVWGSLCLYDDVKPDHFKYSLAMLATSFISILANSFALARMFDSFLVVHLSINKDIIQNTLIDRSAMFLTFASLFTSAVFFRKVFPIKED